MPAVLMLLFLLLLETLMIQFDFGRFIRGGHLAYYSRLHGHVVISGFDDFTLITVSDWRILYQLYRHPLLAAFWWPASYLNYWLLEWLDVNCAIFIIGVVMVVADLYSFVFMQRILREIVGLNRSDALLLTVLFFSFAYIMLSLFVPDHFGLSLFLLLLTLYLGGKCMQAGRPLPAWKTGLLYLLTAGVTLTNGVKTLLADFFVNGRRLFRPQHFLLAVVVPSMLLAGAYFAQYEYIVKPDMKHADEIFRKRVEKDPRFAVRQALRDTAKVRNKAGQLSDNPFFEWTDSKASRWEAVRENFFGESVQLHRRHLLEDVNKTRPVVVCYDHFLNYVIEAMLVLMFVAGCWVGRRSRFFRLCLSWLAFDLVLHLGLGFGIVEIYIMATHWIFIIPLAIGFLLKRLSASWLMVARLAILFMAVFLLVYNGMLIYQYMTHSIIAV